MTLSPISMKVRSGSSAATSARSHCLHSQAAKSATLGKGQSATAAHLRHPSGEGSRLGPRRSPWGRAGGLAERWVAAWDAASRCTLTTLCCG
eukprot:scaffold15907_cov39-Phaeocystis_antarctica.AAC.2